MTVLEDDAERDFVSVPPLAFLVPSPVLILSTEDEKGVPDLSTMSAVGVVCLDPPLLSIGIKPSRKTYKNIRQTRRFVINMPLVQNLDGADFVGTRKIKTSPNKIAESGFTIAHMPKSKLPFIRECPIAIACDVVSILAGSELGITKPSHHCVIGRATECLVERKWIRDDEVRLEEMPLPIYLNRYYANLGGTLGVQRFTDHEEKRELKLKEYRNLSYNHSKTSTEGE